MTLEYLKNVKIILYLNCNFTRLTQPLIKMLFDKFDKLKQEEIQIIKN